MRKKLVGIICGLAAGCALAFQAAAADKLTCNVEAAFFNGSEIDVDGTVFGRADGITLQLSTDKLFTRDVTTVSTQGAVRLTPEPEEGKPQPQVVEYKKTGFEMTVKRYNGQSGFFSIAKGTWSAGNKIKAAALDLSYFEFYGNRTCVSFDVTSTVKYKKDATIYVRLQAEQDGEWGPYSVVRKAVYDDIYEPFFVIKEEAKSVSVTNAPKNRISVKKGGTKKLKVKVKPSDADGKTTFKSSNKKIVTVTNKGVIKGIKKGKAKVTVKRGKKKAVLTVTVK